MGQTNPDERIFRLGKVVSVEDTQGKMRIKTRITPEDNYLSDNELPYSYPLLPKHFHIAPKEDELVLIITNRIGEVKSKRWFIGPLISQQYFLNEENFLSASEEYIDALPNPDFNPENEGTLPDKEDIAIQGRNNADLIFKDNEVRLRCGFKKNRIAKPEEKLLFNKEDLSYIQMKYKNLRDKNGEQFSSSINIVADRINLLTHDSLTNFELNDRKQLITDEELIKIVNNAHPVIFGDSLVDYLKQLAEIIKTHTHPFPNNPPCLTTPQKDVLNTDLTKMLSQGIRVN